MNIDWNKYFDHIYVISWCQNFDRRKHIDEQFKKLGITNYQYWYMASYDLENSKIFKPGVEILNIHRKRSSLSHYTLWKTCYELEYDNILIIEDDAEFIDDLTKIQEMLELYINTDSDIYMFDYIYNTSNEYLTDYLFATCYAVHRYGLQYLIKQHEKYNIQCDHYFFDLNKNYIFITTNYCINTDNNKYMISMDFDIEDIKMILKLSPIKICKQLDQI